jgi:hypothetical protein
MGWLIVPAPTDDRKTLAPCKSPCNHEDCADSKAFVKRLCSLCGKEIGFDTKYFVRGDDPVHAVCKWAEVKP